MKKISLNLSGIVLAIMVAMECVAGTTYLFTVSCQDRWLVAEWNVGDLDPGKEYLRATTGTKYPGCGVGDYNDQRDGHLPRDRYSHEGAVIQGVPLVGPIYCEIFGC